MRLDTFQNFLRNEKRYSEHTVQAYLSDISQCFQYFEDAYEMTLPGEVGFAHARSWMVDLLENGASPRTVNRKLSSLRTYFRFLRARKLVGTNPFAKISGPKSSRRLPGVIEQKALQLLFHHVEFTSDFAGTRDRLVLELLYSAGLRKSEVIGITSAQVDYARNALRILGKGKKTRLVPFGENLGAALRRYENQRNEKFAGVEGALVLTDRGKPMYPKFVFNLVQRYLGMVTTKSQRGPHTLRHSFATHLTDEGADINAIKELLGHSSLAATQVYTHTSIKRLKKSYDQAHPKA